MVEGKYLDIKAGAIRPKDLLQPVEGAPASPLLTDLGQPISVGGVNQFLLFKALHLLITGIQQKPAPEAYLGYALYDADSNMYDQGRIVLSKKARNRHEELKTRIFVPKDGYIEAYVVNESEEDVWFDQFRILSTGPVIVQETHYDPWGVELQGLGYQQGGLKVNKYLYNGKEFNDHLGLNLFDYGARMYDASVGRWSVVDPLAEKRDWLTPYNYVQNNPILRIDPLGLTDFTFNRETGEVTQVGDKNDNPDRILKTDKDNNVRYKKNGDPRVAVDKIQPGILADGQNWKTDDQVIEVGGEGQPTVDGVKSFTLKLSEYISKELKGFSYSADGSGKVSDMLIGKYINNSFDKSFATVEKLKNKFGDNYTNNNLLQEFHTHPGGKLGATQSTPELSQDVKSLQNSRPNMPNASFIILYRVAGREKPAEYDFSHEYRPKKH